MNSETPPPSPRQALRAALLEQRARHMLGATAAEDAAALTRHLLEILRQLEPQALGLYWPHRSEFNAVAGLLADEVMAKVPRSLPYAHRSPVRMEYRTWDGRAPDLVDECGIPSTGGAPTTPDVVLVPCVGFTDAGFRLGYGGGYFDRWLAGHPHVTAIGIAWSGALIDAATLQVQPHDRPLTLVVTERGVA